MKTHHQQVRMALFAVIVLVAGTAAQAVVVSYIAVDLNPSGFTESFADDISGTQQVGEGSGSATGGNGHALLWNGSAASYVDLDRKSVV